jgi:hypothetical protein
MNNKRWNFSEAAEYSISRTKHNCDQYTYLIRHLIPSLETTESFEL